MTTMTTPHGLNVRLAAALPAAGTTLPLNPLDAGKLLDALGTDKHAWLTISDATGAEVVKATAWDGTVLIARGVDGSTAKSFPAGACVDARVTYAGVKDLLCNHDCCKTGDCN